jgi:type I restriction enzyme, R subunit
VKRGRPLHDLGHGELGIGAAWLPGPKGICRVHSPRTRANPSSSRGSSSPKGGGFVTGLSDLVAEFRAAFARIEDLLAGVDDLDLTVHGYASVRAISAFLDSDPAAAEASARDYRMLARLYPHVSTDPRAAKYRDGFGLFGSVYTTLSKKSSDEERKEWLAELGPMVLEIINAS